MTLNEKIKDSVQMTTGLRCFEGTPPDSVTGRFAYFFPLRSGAAKRYNEVAVFFVERPVFTPLDPERATVDCRYLALDWLNGLYAYSGLKFQEIISQNNIRDGFGGYGVGMRLVLVDEARHTGGATPVDNKNYFRMTADGTTAVVGWTGTYPDLEYRKEGDEWTDFTQNVTFYTWIEFRLKEGSTWSATSNSNHFSIQTEGADDHVILSGNIMSLVDPTLRTKQLSTTYCFRSLFRQCTRIVSAENLRLAENTCNYCYAGMFYGCTALETAPSLPSTSAASHCYNGMFTGCTLLTSAPELPATTLAQACYSQMFSGCSSLTTAPTLPATTLAQNCYGNMFTECSSLETAPALPATTLAEGCYSYMFRACTSLTTAPELPATTLVTNCYNSMFIGCTSLEFIKVNFTEWALTTTDYWVENVAASGTFECPDGLSIVYDKDHIPTGWRVVKPTMYNVLAVSGDQTMGSVTGGGSYAVGDTVTVTATPVEGYKFTGWTDNGVTVSTDNPYTFTVSQTVLLQGEFEEEANDYLTMSTWNYATDIYIYKSGNPDPITLEYRVNEGQWTTYDFTNNPHITVPRGGNIQLRGNNNYFSKSQTDYYRIVVDTDGGSDGFNVSGNIMSLLDKTCQSTTIPNSYCFSNLFSNDKLRDASGLSLPATTLANYCYYNMFYGCGTMYAAPAELPATSVFEGAYYGMFKSCGWLGATPDIKAVTIAQDAFREMFMGCSSLTTAHDLSVSMCATRSFSSMFKDCTSLVDAPDFHQIINTGWQGAYVFNEMFSGCTALENVPTLPILKGTGGGVAYKMFKDCTSLETIELYIIGRSYDAYEMFSGCSSLNSITLTYPQNWGATNAFTNWVYGVAATGDFYCSTDVPDLYGDSNIPTGWTRHNID